MFSVFSNLLHAKNRLSVFVVVVIVCLCFCLFFALMDSIQNGKDSIHQGKVTEGNRDNRHVNNINNNTIKHNIIISSLLWRQRGSEIVQQVAAFYTDQVRQMTKLNCQSWMSVNLNAIEIYIFTHFYNTLFPFLSSRLHFFRLGSGEKHRIRLSRRQRLMKEVA